MAEYQYNKMKYSNINISLFKALMAYNLNLYNNIRNDILKEKTLTACERIKKLTEIHAMLKKNLKKIIK